MNDERSKSEQPASDRAGGSGSSCHDLLSAGDIVRVAYIVCSTITEVMLLGLAVAAPVWITPGWYWWTVFAVLLMLCRSLAFTERLNSWGCGTVE